MLDFKEAVHKIHPTLFDDKDIMHFGASAQESHLWHLWLHAGETQDTQNTQK